MVDPTDLAAALEGALHRLDQRVTALRQALAGSRTTFVRGRARGLEADHRTHEELAAEVQALEAAAAARRTELCLALGLPDSARLGAIAACLPAATGRRLCEAAARVRTSLQALRVETAVGQRLLDLSRRAQEGLLLHLAGAAAHRAGR
jgi:hypothetical protein